VKLGRVSGSLGEFVVYDFGVYKRKYENNEEEE